MKRFNPFWKPVSHLAFILSIDLSALFLSRNYIEYIETVYFLNGQRWSTGARRYLAFLDFILLQYLMIRLSEFYSLAVAQF